MRSPVRRPPLERPVDHRLDRRESRRLAPPLNRRRQTTSLSTTSLLPMSLLPTSRSRRGWRRRVSTSRPRRPRRHCPTCCRPWPTGRRRPSLDSNRRLRPPRRRFRPTRRGRPLRRLLGRLSLSSRRRPNRLKRRAPTIRGPPRWLRESRPTRRQALRLKRRWNLDRRLNLGHRDWNSRPIPCPRQRRQTCRPARRRSP